MKYKKGSYILSIGLMLIVLFALAIVGIVLRPVVKEISAANLNLNLSAKSVETSEKFDEKYVGFWDSSFLFIFLAICLGLWMSSWYIDTHPMFFIIAILCMVVFVAISMLIGDGFNNLVSGNALSSSASEFVIIPFFMSNFVVIITVVGFITGAILYAKSKSGSGGGIA